MQLHARPPLDIRRLYRRSHPLIPKALGIYASVGLRLHRLTGRDEALSRAMDALQILMNDTTAGESAWGYHWDMQTRWSFYRAGSPNVVVTTFAASALAEAAAATSGERAALMESRAIAAAEWVRDALWMDREGYFAYHPGSPANIHNANLLGAWLVDRHLSHDAVANERVDRAIARTLAAQRPDGSWGYGEGSNLEWADSFHTGYVLTCLARLGHRDPAIMDAVRRGMQFYRGFFGADGTARLWARKRYPEDAHSAGTGMTTLAAVGAAGVDTTDLLERVTRRAALFGVRDGHAIYRRYRWGSTRVHYLRWADAHLALGLVDAATRLAR
jgi:hypothetical protein